MVWGLFGRRSVVEQQGNFVVYKQLDGRYRWVGVGTNNFEDREREILTEAAHREFLEYLDQNPSEAPEFWCWHTPGTARKHRVDLWDYVSGFVVYSGLLEEDEALPYMINNTREIGMSHGFYILQRDGSSITKYRSFEVSDLLLEYAANAYTDFGVIMAQKGFSEVKRNYLVEAFGEDAVNELETELERKEAILTTLNIRRKEQEQDEAQDMGETNAMEALNLAEKIVGQVREALDLDDLNDLVVGLQTTTDGQLSEMANAVSSVVKAVADIYERLESIEDVVTTLRKSTDERIAELLTKDAPIQLAWGNGNETASTAAVEIAAMKQAIANNTWMAGLDPRV